jgi:L-glyceraldehyde 3-phosphate reductase
MLSNKYLRGMPAGSRATQGKSLSPDLISKDALKRISALNDIAKKRGQSLAQMAISWVLRDGRMTSALIGASRPEQIAEIVEAAQNTSFTKKELSEIDRYAEESNINLWKKSNTA